jgi:hypothetical protein
MFKLAIIITIAMGSTETKFTRAELDHNFRSEIGCYLAGATEVAQMKQTMFMFELPPNITIDIECSK